MTEPKETESYAGDKTTAADLPKAKGPKRGLAREIRADQEYEVFNTCKQAQLFVGSAGAHVLPPTPLASLRMTGAAILHSEKAFEVRVKYGKIEIREARPR